MFITQHIYAQSLSECWQYASNQQGIMHAMMQSLNGEVVIVGEEPNGKYSNGLMLFINPITGSLIRTVSIEGTDAADGTFHAIAQAHDGSFYLAGTLEKKGEKPKAWLVHVDENGKQIDAYFKQNLGYGSLQHLLVMEDNSLLIVGKKEEDDGAVWLIKYADGTKLLEQEIGAGAFRTVEGVAFTNTGEVLLCGNTEKSKQRTSKQGDIWLAKLDKNVQLVQEKIIRHARWTSIHNASRTYDGNLLFVGEKVIKNKEVWLGEVNSDLEFVLNKTIQEKGDEVGRSIAKNFHQQYLLIDFVEHAEKNRATLYRSFNQEEEKLLLETAAFTTTGMLRSFQGQYIVGGVRGFNKNYTIDLHCLKEHHPTIGKSNATLKIISTPKLEDTNRDGIFSEGERGWVSFRVRNEGFMPVIAAKVAVNARSKNSGLQYFQESFIDYIGVEQERIIRIPFRATLALKTGTHHFDIRIKVQDQIVAESPLELKANVQGQAMEMLIVSWNNGLSNDTRSIRTTTNKAKLNVRAYSSYALRSEDFKMRINGVILEDSKSMQLQFAESQQNGRFEYNLGIEFLLQEGINELEVVIQKNNVEQSTGILSIDYEERKPNLHVLAIAPHYKDLQYNDNDAFDFTNLLQAQAGKGIFNKVYATILTDSLHTTTQALRDAVLDFVKKRDGQQILPNDVVLVFFSSHGTIYDNRFKIVPSDYDSQRAATRTIDYELDVLRLLDEVNCKKIIFADACQSGAAGSKDIYTKDPNISSALNRLNNTQAGLITVSSCKDQQLSYENKAWQNGAFTEALLEALSGKSVMLQNGERIKSDIQENIGLLSIHEIYEFVAKRVPDLVTTQIGQTGQQKPVLFDKNLAPNLELFLIPD